MTDFPSAPDFPFSIVGFDLDGTLVDSNRDLAPAINHALASIDREAISDDKTRDLIGGGARLMLERALAITGGPLPPDEFEALFATLIAHYEEHIADNTVPYDGCLEALEALAARGVKLAVVTNKAEHPARRLLGELGLAHLFTSIMGGDSLGPDRAKPKRDMIDETIARCRAELDGESEGAGGNPPRFAMVGDSTYDVGAARNAGVPVVVVSFGYADVPVPELGGDVLIDHFDELIGALERL